MDNTQNGTLPAETEHNAVKEFLDAIPHEGETISPEGKGNDTTPASSTEKDGEKTAPAAPEDKKESEENLPFHKHPRWKKVVEERNQLKAEVDKVNAKLVDIENKLVSPPPTPTIPQWFVELYGNNVQAWDLYQTYTAAEKERMKTEIIQDAQKAAEQEQQQAAAMDKWVTDNLQVLKDEGLKFDDNKLLKILVDYSPTDKDGNIDFKKGYEILAKLEKVEAIEADQKTKAKKDIAASTTSSPAGDNKGKKGMTAKDIRKMSWHDAVSP